jgi:hypothetical protein
LFAKLVVLILTIGGVAATLLAARQQRLYAVHESAQAMRRIVEHDRTLWRLRSEIAERVTPNKVRKLVNRFGPLAYFYSERSTNLATGELVLHRPPARDERTTSVPEPDHKEGQ